MGLTFNFGAGLYLGVEGGVYFLNANESLKKNITSFIAIINKTSSKQEG